MRISAVLAAKGSFVATVAPGDTVAAAVAALRQHGVGALVVSDDGQHIEGIISERDIVRRLADGPGLLEQPVAALMTSLVATCSPDSDTEELMATMTDRRIRHVPVVHDGQLAGIVSIGDVVKARIEELERDRRDLVEYIGAR
jgi:CBS domain-containing protein